MSRLKYNDYKRFIGKSGNQYFVKPFSDTLFPSLKEAVKFYLKTKELTKKAKDFWFK